VALKIALDANRYSDLARGDVQLQFQLEAAERIVLPIVVVGELRAGFAVGRKGRENEGVLQRFLAKPEVSVLALDRSTTQVYAALFRQLRQQGTPIPINDLWIAALVVQHDLVLCTRDGHFQALPQLDLL